MDDETRAEFEEQAEKYRALDDMIKTLGWKKCIIPRIDSFKEKHTKTLLNSTNYREIIRAQESLKAIDELLSDLMYDLKQGEEAIEELAKEKS